MKGRVSGLYARASSATTTAPSLGFRTAWVNRCRESAAGDVGFDHEWDSLWRLCELVET